MEFITLRAALDGIVASIPPRPYVSESIAEKFKDDESVLAAHKFWAETALDRDDARRFSDAARMLNNALNQSDLPPPWWGHSKADEGWDRDDANHSIANEGRDLLRHATGWGKREQKLHAEYIADCERNGLHPARNDLARNMNDGRTPVGSFFRFHEIGFNRAELIPFLDANKIAHDLGGATQAAGTKPASVKLATVPIRYDLLATRAELCTVFGVWGLSMGMFKKLDRQWLLNARKRKGQGQRGHIIEPLFCPFEVMRGLATKTRKPKFTEVKGWDVLENRFKTVFEEYQLFDTRVKAG